MEIISKEKNQKTGKKDTLRIAVDDIDEIEHIDGTLQFYIHYQGAKRSKIGGFLRKKINKKSSDKKERSDLFESKFVK